ncbi:MAG: peptide chain release factor N(5)-glutamine methyltransferase [Tannerellaceae bacterium]|nr:peptide chain release factor N(5)-glutamine methyltransferase [Tannerellaceae bacterium]
MNETLSYINQSLKSLYPPGEIQSFSRLIMEHVCGLSHHQLLIRDRVLSQTDRLAIEEIVERLRKAEPIQYILGTTTFYGLTFRVNPATLIPRPETEELVDRVIKKHTGQPIRILDIGTGSGCIAITLSKYLPEAQIMAIDISEEALATARENNRRNNTPVAFVRTDILDIPQAGKDIPGTFDLIVSNPPYVLESEKNEMEKNVLLYEPWQALFVPDNDPLRFYRAIIGFGNQKLNKGGYLYFEINAQCGKQVVELLRQEGYEAIELLPDISGKDRMIKAHI